MASRIDMIGSSCDAKPYPTLASPTIRSRPSGRPRHRISSARFGMPRVCIHVRVGEGRWRHRGLSAMVKTRTAAKQVMGSVEWALLLTLALLWGGSFFFSKIAVGELPPLTVVLCRVALAALALNVVVLISRRRMPADPRA